MTNTPLRYYKNGTLVATVVDPRFGTDAAPTQPEGWGGTGGGGESGGAVDAGHLMVVNGGTVTLPAGALVGDLAGYRVTAPAAFTDGTLTVALGEGGYIFELTSTGWTYLALPAPARLGGAPTPGTLTAGITDKAVVATVAGAYDDTALHALPYRFSSDGGATWTAWKATPGHLFRTTASTAYNLRHAVRDAAENITPSVVVPVTTTVAGRTLGSWNIVSGFTADGEYLTPGTADSLAWRTTTGLTSASIRAVVTSERVPVGSAQMLSGPVFRYVDAANFCYYSFGSGPANWAELRRVVAGSDTLVTRWTPSVDYNNKEMPFVARADINGNVITCYDRDGVTAFGTATVTDHSASNNVGLRKGSTISGGASWSLTVY